MYVCHCCVYTIFAVLAFIETTSVFADLRSPQNQYLPDDCTNSRAMYIYKNTTTKAGVCTLIKDEEGFLAEFVAFYIVQGVDHIIFYDDNSTDLGTTEELQPFVSAGYVSIQLAGQWEGYRGSTAETWGQQMAQKKMMERHCKMTLHSMKIDYYISVDLDEYEFPIVKNVTLVDEIHRLFTMYPTRGTFNVKKLQFTSQPHILEPFDKLTIEAYQTRFSAINKFSPKKSLMPKTVYWLRNPIYSNETLRFILECCTFHSCKQGPLPFCWDLQKTELSKVFHSPWPDIPFVINHYSRSIEKFSLKQKTWKQHVNAGYDINKFFERSHGWTFDNSAVRYACQTRQVIASITKKFPFYRRGNWLRKYEIGKNPLLYAPVL